MKYRITVGVDIHIHPADHEDLTFTGVMNAFREGLRLNHNIASRIERLTLMECRLIETEKEKPKLMETKDANT